MTPAEEFHSLAANLRRCTKWTQVHSIAQELDERAIEVAKVDVLTTVRGELQSARLRLDELRVNDRLTGAERSELFDKSLGIGLAIDIIERYSQ